MKLYPTWLRTVQFIGFDDSAGGDPPAGDPPAGDPPTGKVYTEEEFNSHQAGLRRKYEARETELKTTQRQLADELTRLKSQKGVSDEERQQYDQRIKQLEESFLTDKEKLERRAKHQQTEYETKIQSLQSERERFESDYKNEVVRNQIFAAQAENGGVDAEAFDAILGRMISWEEELVDGEPNGKVKPVVNFADVDKEGQPVKMKYSVSEAVKRMKELPKYNYLFVDNLKSGLGGAGNASGGGPIDIAKLAKENPAEYRRLRKENPAAIYGN